MNVKCRPVKPTKGEAKITRMSATTQSTLAHDRDSSPAENKVNYYFLVPERIRSSTAPENVTSWH